MKNKKIKLPQAEELFTEESQKSIDNTSDTWREDLRRNHAFSSSESSTTECKYMIDGDTINLDQTKSKPALDALSNKYGKKMKAFDQGFVNAFGGMSIQLLRYLQCQETSIEKTTLHHIQIANIDTKNNTAQYQHGVELAHTDSSSIDHILTEHTVYLDTNKIMFNGCWRL